MFIDKIVKPQYVIQFLHSRQDREHFKHIDIGSVNILRNSTTLDFKDYFFETPFDFTSAGKSLIAPGP